MRESTADDEESTGCHDGSSRVTFHSLIPRHDVFPAPREQCPVDPFRLPSSSSSKRCDYWSTIAVER